MGGWSSNINQALRDVVSDHGIWHDIDLMNFMRDEAALLITGSTTPVSVITSDYLMYRWAASNSDAMTCKIRIPREAAYLVSKKTATANVPFLQIRLNLALRSGGTTDNPYVTVTGIGRSATGAQKGTFTPTSIDADGSVLSNGRCKVLTSGGTTNPELRTWDFFETYASGPLYLAPGDTLDLKIVPAAHTTDTLELHQAYLQIALNPAFTDRALRV